MCAYACVLMSCSSTLDAECMRSVAKQTGNDSTQEYRIQYRETVQVIYLPNTITQYTKVRVSLCAKVHACNKERRSSSQRGAH